MSIMEINPNLWGDIYKVSNTFLIFEYIREVLKEQSKFIGDITKGLFSTELRINDDYLLFYDDHFKWEYVVILPKDKYPLTLINIFVYPNHISLRSPIDDISKIIKLNKEEHLIEFEIRSFIKACLSSDRVHNHLEMAKFKFKESCKYPHYFEL